MILSTSTRSGIIQKKMRDNKVIIYDQRSMPPGYTMEDILEIYMSTGFIVYDSMSIANVPFVTDVNNLDETRIVKLDLNKIHESNIQISRSE